MNNMSRIEVEAEWTGEYPNLCSGEWKLSVGGIDFSYLLEKRGEMDTLGSYSRWHFNEDWSEEWDSYEDGLGERAWIKKNQDWLSIIGKKTNCSADSLEALYVDIYYAIQDQDWRHGSCGGCI